MSEANFYLYSFGFTICLFGFTETYYIHTSFEVLFFNVSEESVRIYKINLGCHSQEKIGRLKPKRKSSVQTQKMPIIYK